MDLEFPSAGEHVLHVMPRGQETIIASEAFFGTPAEFAGLRPFRGDLHMHTTGSDGKATAMAMAHAASQAGNDFIAITDHDNWEPSRQAIDDAAAAGLDLLIIPGEEVTIRDNGGHILSLGASTGVSVLRKGAEADAECERIVADEIAGRTLVYPLTPAQYANAVWTMRKIRELGGIAMIAHPYWVGSGHRFYPPRCLVDQLLQDRLCDGIELMGGSPTTEGNRLAVACYVEQAARGWRLPVIGGSDAHYEANLVNTYWTIAFAPELTVDSIKQAIVQRRTFACDGKTGESAAIYGPLDLLEYAYFAHREFFPIHRELCRQGGKGDVEAFRRAFWHEPAATA